MDVNSLQQVSNLHENNFSEILDNWQLLSAILKRKAYSIQRTSAIPPWKFVVAVVCNGSVGTVWNSDPTYYHLHLWFNSLSDWVQLDNFQNLLFSLVSFFQLLDFRYLIWKKCILLNWFLHHPCQDYCGVTPETQNSKTKMQSWKTDQFHKYHSRSRT